MNYLIIDWKEGERFDGELLITNVVKGVSNSGAPYLSLTLQDKTGSIEAKKWDATVLDEEKVGQMDVVIADLPCSGLGVLGKKTDLKYKTSEEIQKSLVQLQRDILKQVQQYVKPEGTLIYSTCTIHEGENMGNVRWFLENFPEFELVSIKDKLCEELKQDVIEEGCMQFLPGKHQSDGFFISKFRKVKHG
jgi:16S rRNA (cytosine967-C5)-methyltransferase